MNWGRLKQGGMTGVVTSEGSSAQTCSRSSILVGKKMFSFVSPFQTYIESAVVCVVARNKGKQRNLIIFTLSLD